jgi:hypothetical protein
LLASNFALFEKLRCSSIGSFQKNFSNVNKLLQIFLKRRQVLPIKSSGGVSVASLQSQKHQK